MKVSESDKCGQTDSQSDAANVHFLCQCVRAEGRFSEDGHMFIAGLTASGKGRKLCGRREEVISRAAGFLHGCWQMECEPK